MEKKKFKRPDEDCSKEDEKLQGSFTFAAIEGAETEPMDASGEAVASKTIEISHNESTVEDEQA